MRNKVDFEYLPYIGMGSDVNSDGEHTGDYSDNKIEYGDPVPCSGNISVPSGQTKNTFFGTDIQYSHVLIMDPPGEDFNEYGLIRWNDDLYEIKAVCRSLNGFSAALLRQTKNNAPVDSGDEE